jgi:hypothetical protein
MEALKKRARKYTAYLEETIAAEPTIPRTQDEAIMEANRRIIQQRFKDSMELWNDTLRAIHKK